MLLAGITAGIFTALFQSGGYIFSRIYLKRAGNAVSLMILAQLLIALFSVPLLLLTWKPGAMSGSTAWILPLFLSALGTTCGELMFFQAEHQIAPSRLSSMMGLRVVLLAVFSAAFGMESFGWMQVAGVLLAASSAILINWQNGGFALRGMGWMAASLGFYCISDLSIRVLIRGIDTGSILYSSLIAVAWVNLLIGVVMIPFFFLRRIGWRESFRALPYSLTWYAKQICLYLCYASIGPVFGNVVMSSRGPLAILLTLLLLHLGLKDLEHPQPRSVWLRRGLATLLMIGSVAFYSFGAV